MPRRALRKHDAEVDLSRHLRELTTLLPEGEATEPRPPLDPQSFFDQPAPVEIEMGSGKGLFLLNAALAHPERNYLGVEMANKYAEFCALRLARQNVPNGRMISGDGVRMFRELLPADCAAAVHVYFPDPWWKMRHRKRRVMNAGFVRDIQRVLQPGGSLHFWTDVEEYYLGTLELLAAETTLTGPLPVLEQTPAHDMDYRTNFERRKRMDGLPIYRSEYRK
ncbi:MAG TPA: tRNA (guanosine(46)-N7)-methyltransferase TrmB [Pirellulaceae bacterium]|nr:tRNA (guanosine(46)-N7)-methyltransferase TrmB [Pirellulaceae bacterium]